MILKKLAHKRVIVPSGIIRYYKRRSLMHANLNDAIISCLIMLTDQGLAISYRNFKVYYYFVLFMSSSGEILFLVNILIVLFWNSKLKMGYLNY